MYPTKKLSEICEIINGGTPDTSIPSYWNGDIFWITPKDMGQLENIYVSETSRTISESGMKNSSAKLFPIYSVILSSRAPIGHLAVNTVPMCTNQGCKGLIPKANLNYIYLYYFLKNSKNLLNDLGSGTTFKELSSTKLKEVEIPLPPFSTQSRIVAKLDSAFGNIDEQIKLLRGNIADVEDMGRSILEEIFQSNEYEIKKLGEVVTFLSGGTPSKSNKSFWIGSIPWISPKDMKRAKIDSATDYVSESAVASSATRLLPVNSLLCVTRSGILVHSFPVAINTVPVTFNQDIRAIVPGKTINSEYLYYALKGKEREIISKGIKKGPTVHSIISGYLDNLLIPLPPLPHQQEIVTHLDAVFDKSRVLQSEYETQIQDLEVLKQSLLEEAFAGRLVTE